MQCTMNNESRQGKKKIDFDTNVYITSAEQYVSQMAKCHGNSIVGNPRVILIVGGRLRTQNNALTTWFAMMRKQIIPL